MKKQKLLFLLAVCAVCNSARSQSYKIRSFEGQWVKISLTDKSWYNAKVSCLTDSLFLSDYNGISGVHVLGDKFLEIIYDTRGGTGSQFKNTLILSVKSNKINVAVLTNSFGNAFGSDIDGSLYVVKFSIVGNNKSNFKLVAHIYDRHKSESHPKENYVSNKKVILNFDSVQNIFYSTHKNVTQSFTTNDPKTQHIDKQQISGLLPVIVFGKERYYFIKGEWYRNDYGNSLFKGYYR